MKVRLGRVILLIGHGKVRLGTIIGLIGQVKVRLDSVIGLLIGVGESYTDIVDRSGEV